jgi:hypothetical protein
MFGKSCPDEHFFVSAAGGFGSRRVRDYSFSAEPANQTRA